MFKQLRPVPSTAAIRALRGLIFGTSCTFALVAEDRRRRINAARTVLRNAERLKSDKRYYAGGTAAVLALEDNALHDPAMIEGMRKRGTLPAERNTHQSRRRLEKALAARTHSTQDARAESYPTPASTEYDVHGERPLYQQGRRAVSHRAALPEVFLPPLSDRHSPGVRQTWGTGPAVDESLPIDDPDLSALQLLITPIADGIGKKDRQSTTDAIQLLRKVLDSQTAPWEAPARFLEVSAELCRSCQDLGLMDEAATVLKLVVEKVQLDGPAYFAHRPLPVVEHLLPSDDWFSKGSTLSENGAVEPSKEPTTIDQQRRVSFLEKLDEAERMFLPDAIASYQNCPPAATEMGRKLLEGAFSVGSMKHVRRVFRKLVGGSADLSDILPWYFGRLKDTRSHPWTIRSFLMVPKSQLSSLAWFWRLSDTVVGAVTASHGLLAADVLRRLLELAHGQYQLGTYPVCELLYRHWKRSRDFQGVSELFAELLEGSIADRVQYVDAPFRTMMQIALEAEEFTQAEAYAQQLTSLAPEAANDIRIQGLLAQAKAKKNDWAGVRDTFERVRQSGLSLERAGPVLVPLLKEYARTHPIHETEQWLKDYIDNIGVPVCREMVTLVGREYGDRRDHESFIAWLEYCVNSGLVVDAAFSNTILRNCWKRWRFPFKRLGSLYKKLCLLSPNFEDEVTRRIMAGSALTRQAVASRSGQARLKWLGLHVDNSISRGRCSNEEEVYLAMKTEAQRTGPQKAAWIYKQAMKSGMPPSDKCLKLMVALSAQRGGTGKVATHLLGVAKAKGNDVNAAAAHLVVRELKHIKPGSTDRRDILREVQAAIRPFEASGVKLNDMVLNRAARIVFDSRDVHNATSLGLVAAKLAGKAPGYNLDNLTVLLWCYSLQRNADGIELLVRNFAKSGDARWGDCIFVLRRANRMILKLERDAKTAKALMAVRAGLRLAEREWGAFEEACTKVESFSVKLMQDAARRAGNKPVALDELPDLQWTEPSLRSELGAEMAADEEWQLVDEFSARGEPEIIDEAHRPSSPESSSTDAFAQLRQGMVHSSGQHRAAGCAAF